MKDKLLKIINHYGVMKQLKYIHTEYFELDEAIIDCKKDEYERFDYDKATHVAEEIADVMVMLKQFQYYYSIEDEDIGEIMKFKIDRQLERISKEQMENL